MINSIIAKSLTCPDCSSKVQFSNAETKCTGCERIFENENEKLFFFPKVQLREIEKQTRIMSQDNPTWDYFDFDIIIPETEKEDSQALDVGCGEGAKQVLTKCGYEVTGFDVFPGDQVDIVGDGHLLPFQNETFDLVTSMCVLEHLHDPWKGCREMSRVLKKGGHLACSMSFLEPFHANSYFHFSHLGVKKIMKASGINITKFLPLGFTYAEANLRQLLPIPFLPAIAGKTVRFILALRQFGISCFASYYKNKNTKKYNRAVSFAEEDRYRFEAGFKILGIKE